MKRVRAGWRLWLAQDGLAWLTVLALLAAGLAFIYSASWRGDETGIVGAWFPRQVWWVVIGLGAALFFSTVDYRVWLRQAWWLYLIGVGLLLLVLLIGTKVYGATRWLNFFGVLVQPSEFAKVAVVVLLARILGLPSARPRDLSTVLAALLLAGLPFALILKEPDLGTAAILLPTTVLMLFASGAKLRHLFGLAGLGAVISPLGWFVLGDYQRERILTFVDPSRDPLDSGWNALQSAIAVGSGGWSGKGFLNGTQSVLGFLPRTVSPTDFIFPVIAEETGFIGASLLLLAFGVLLTRYIRTAWTAKDPAGSLLATGIAGLVFCHVFVNIGMTIGLLPIIGITLPFVSYGGSSLLASFIVVGLVLNFAWRPRTMLARPSFEFDGGDAMFQ